MEILQFWGIWGNWTAIKWAKNFQFNTIKFSFLTLLEKVGLWELLKQPVVLLFKQFIAENAIFNDLGNFGLFWGNFRPCLGNFSKFSSRKVRALLAALSCSALSFMLVESILYTYTNFIYLYIKPDLRSVCKRWKLPSCRPEAGS